MLRLTNIRANQNRKMGDPGPEGSIGKMASADLNKDIYATSMDLLGAEGMLYGSYEMIRPETAMGSDTPQKAFLRSRANSIEGGTTEVMKNILGERVLGLPGDVRVDRDVPWSAGTSQLRRRTRRFRPTERGEHVARADGCGRPCRDGRAGSRRAAPSRRSRWRSGDRGCCAAAGSTRPRR